MGVGKLMGSYSRSCLEVRNVIALAGSNLDCVQLTPNLMRKPLPTSQVTRTQILLITPCASTLALLHHGRIPSTPLNGAQNPKINWPDGASGV